MDLFFFGMKTKLTINLSEKILNGYNIFKFLCRGVMFVQTLAD